MICLLSVSHLQTVLHEHKIYFKNYLILALIRYSAGTRSDLTIPRAPLRPGLKEKKAPGDLANLPLLHNNRNWGRVVSSFNLPAKQKTLL